MSLKAAFFDVDGTVVKANALNHYFYLSTRDISVIKRWGVALRLASQIPYYFFLDRVSRDRFNQVFYKNYQNWEVVKLQRWSEQYLQEKLRDRIFPDAINCIAQHQKQGDRVFLITGSLDLVIAPLAQFLGVDGVIATKLETKDGYCTGEITGISPVGEEKAKAIKQVSQSLDIDLSKSYAYGDSTSDLPMLQTVGYSIAVNPSHRLTQIAKQEKWLIKSWKF